MSVAPSQSVVITFRVKDATGILADADSLPSAVLYRNGSATAVSVTVASITGTGKYSASWTNAGYSVDDQLEIEATATVSGTSYTEVVWVSSVANVSSLASQTSVDTIDSVVDSIKAKTDNLPSDPADVSDIASSFASITSSLATVAGYIDTEVAVIKAKTDNLPNDPATETTLATLDGLLDAIKAITDQITFTEGLVDANASATIDGADIRDAVGLASANLDTQLAAIDTGVGNVPTAQEIAAEVEREDGTLASIEAAREVVLTVPQSLVDTAKLDGGVKQVARGTAWTDTVDGIGDLTGAVAIYYALKMGDVDDDSAMILVRKNLNGASGEEGIVRIAGEASATTSDASISHVAYDDNGTTKNRFVIEVSGEASALITPTLSIAASCQAGYTRSSESNGYLRGWKLVGASDSEFNLGTMRVTPGIVRATS